MHLISSSVGPSAKMSISLDESCEMTPPNSIELTINYFFSIFELLQKIKIFVLTTANGAIAKLHISCKLFDNNVNLLIYDQVSPNCYYRFGK